MNVSTTRFAAATLASVGITFTVSGLLLLLQMVGFTPTAVTLCLALLLHTVLIYLASFLVLRGIRSAAINVTGLYSAALVAVGFAAWFILQWRVAFGINIFP